MRFSLVLLLTLATAGAAQAQARGPFAARASHAEGGGPIALFDETTLYVSRDDGSTFTAMAAPVPNVRDVAIEQGGTLVVLGGTDRGEEARMARVRADASAIPVAIPGWVQSIAVGGDALIATFPYEASIGISSHGGDFVLHRVPPAFATEECAHDPSSVECAEARVLSNEASLFVDRDGTAHLVDVEVNTCGSSDILDWARVLVVDRGGSMRARAMFRATADPEDAFAGVTAVPPGISVYPTRWTAGPHGWIYALTETGRIAALGRSGARPRVLEAIAGVAPDAVLMGGSELTLASNGALTVAQLGSALVRLDGTRARVLDRSVPDDASVVDVDARGRVLALSPAGLHRWSRRGGWQRIWSAP